MINAPSTSQHFNRFELKFLLHYKQAREFVERISSHVHADPNAVRDGFYKIVSVYYDSPGLACYWEKLDGEKYRRKVRVRTYGDTPDLAFIEIKQRLNLNVQKRRLKAPLAEVQEEMQRICAGHYPGAVHPVLDEVSHLYQRYQLRPTLLVSYNRAAYFDSMQKGLRITLDRNIRCRNLDLDPAHSRTRGRHAVPPQFLILEVKFDETMPRWLATVMNSMDFELQRISKYCQGIERCGMQQGLIRHPD